MIGSITADLRRLGLTVEADAFLEHELDEFADKVRDTARDMAPVFGETGRDDRRESPPEGEPGDFKDTITTTFVGPGHRRVGSTDQIALWQEVGTKHFPELAIFAKTAKLYGGTGPVIDQGVQHAQGELRGHLELLAKMTAEGAGAHQIRNQRIAVDRARTARSAAFRAAGPRRRGRSR